MTVITGQALEPLLTPTLAIGSGLTGEEGAALPAAAGALPAPEEGLGWGQKALPSHNAFRLPPKHADVLAQRKKPGDSSTRPTERREACTAVHDPEKHEQRLLHSVGAG